MKSFWNWLFGTKESKESNVAKIPMMITRDMRQRLYDLNYSRVEVDSMLPSDAWEILNRCG